MKKYEIQIDNDFDKLLEKVAKKNNIPTENYASSIVNSWLEGQFRGEIFEKIKKKTLDELKHLDI